ncbi:HET-domain-containing protein [Aspergillus neoniger CBS 115656]|uniref:HET-domain-containing protein n=1 Tax=Aspergillus neoniger (strain CBS 115656) TaxID=1448310 RepID=A0A318YCJ6_ASPNB|nr:HET-domain-containing protein [Aspergillus neoniger CBS 115656]PYH32135.1 HET-domain-containing protein [Aspergillus neoniger CBS 115656]
MTLNRSSRYTWVRRLAGLKEEDSGDESDGSLSTIVSEIPRDRISALISRSDSCIGQVTKIITKNKISQDDQVRSDSASSPIILNDGDLPNEPKMRNLAPGRLAFRKAGNAFCQEQQRWRSIIQSEDHRATFEELRWAIRLGGWKNDNPKKRLTQLIKTRSEKIEKTKAKIVKITKTKNLLLKTIEACESQVNEDDASMRKLQLPRIEEDAKRKKSEMEQATEEYQDGMSNLAYYEEEQEWLKQHLEDLNGRKEGRSGQVEEAVNDEGNPTDDVESLVSKGKDRVEGATKEEVLEVLQDPATEDAEQSTSGQKQGGDTNSQDEKNEEEKEEGNEVEEDEEDEEMEEREEREEKEEKGDVEDGDVWVKTARLIDSEIKQTKSYLVQVEEDVENQKEKNKELEKRRDEAWHEYQKVSKESAMTRRKADELDQNLTTFRGQLNKLGEKKKQLEEFEKQQEQYVDKLEKEAELAKEKLQMLNRVVGSIEEKVQKEVVDHFSEPEPIASTQSNTRSSTDSDAEDSLRRRVEDHLSKTKLIRYLDTEQDKALAALRTEVKQNPDLNLADEEIDELLKVNCALFVTQPLGRSKSAKKKIYMDLEEREFRLLILCRAPNKYHPLIARLRKDNFQEETSDAERPDEEKGYAALSYSWGDVSANHHIYLLPEGTDRIEDSVSLPIRENLFCALHRLRRKDENVKLWVDALCINQEDNAEKTRQLACMVDIYSQARIVCIWLGESDTEKRSDKAMEFIPRLVDMATLDANTDNEDNAHQWAALLELTRDPWFSRRWIVQEISLARNAVVYCGEKMVHWDMLVDAIALLGANEERVRALFDPSKWRYGRNTLGEIQLSSANILFGVTSSLFPTSEERSKHKPLRSLEYLVTTLQTFDASDPRDLIYALVHISRDHSEERIEMARQLTQKQQTAEEVHQRAENQQCPKKVPKLHVDYGTPIHIVFKQFTQYCVEASGSLDIICRPWAKLPKLEERSLLRSSEDYLNNSLLPSWVPLLENAEFGGPGQSHKGRKNGRSFVGIVGQQIYDASNGMQAKSVTFGENPMCMKVSGLLLGTVEEVSPRCSAGVVFRESLRLGGWEGIDNGPKVVPARIWRTLIADRTSNGLSPPPWYQRACLRSLEIADMFSGGDLNTGQLPDEVVFVRDYLRRVREVTWNRCFFGAASHEDAHISDIHRATGDAKANAELQASNDGDDVPEIVVENADQTEHKETIDAELNIIDAEKLVQGGDAVEQAEEIEPVEDSKNAEKHVQGQEETSQARQEEPVDTSKGVDDPNVLVPHEPKTVTLSEQQGRNHTSEQDAKSDSERTEDWFGICPRNTSIKDKVCILFGCSVPVILHPVGKDTYELVGEAYVHGAMSGEVVRNMEKEALERSTRIFDIR